MTNIGILALQGAVIPHAQKLEQLKVKPVFVRNPGDLESLRGIILPGGESTAMIHLLHLNRLWEPLAEFMQMRPVWGLCAGAILMAKAVTHPQQESFGVIDIEIERNAYGRQMDSFVDILDACPNWAGEPNVEGVFIRAPRIHRMGVQVRPLFQHRGEVVMVAEKNCLAATFHPELTDSLVLHKYFLQHCEEHRG